MTQTNDPTNAHGRNTELFNKIADQIENEPESYNQGEWWCGTTGCVAGWAIQFTPGARWISPLGVEMNGVLAPIEVAAADVLGLKLGEAADLFDDGWTPVQGLTVPEALRKIGGGDPVEDVSYPV